MPRLPLKKNGSGTILAMDLYLSQEYEHESERNSATGTCILRCHSPACQALAMRTLRRALSVDLKNRLRSLA